MKKLKNNILSTVCLLIIVSLMLQIACIGYATETVFSTKEVCELSFFDKNLCKNKQLIYLKDSGKLDAFIDYLYTEYNKQKSKNTEEITELLNFWNLSINSDMKELRKVASIVLNERLNIKIDSKEFCTYVKSCLSDEKNGLFSSAENDSEFGPLYLYMCTYYEITDESDYALRLLSNYDYNTITLKQLFDFDFDYNFSETQIPILLYEYIEKNAKSASSAWPSLNGYTIQQYAEDWTNTSDDDFHNPDYIYIDDGGDCTNFASQCLFAGGLPMTSYAGEENSDGYVDTDTRWFYFDNNTISEHSISTSWVRVKELYNYLSPHYACGERLANSGMTPYLNRGFLLQGKYIIGSYKHSVIVTIKNNSVCYCAHTNQRHNEPISTFYSGYYKCREVQIY